VAASLPASFNGGAKNLGFGAHLCADDPANTHSTSRAPSGRCSSVAWKAGEPQWVICSVWSLGWRCRCGCVDVAYGRQRTTTRSSGAAIADQDDAVVSYRTLPRYATARLGFGPRKTTVRVVDCEPGADVQVGFGRLGWLTDQADRRRHVVRGWSSPRWAVHRISTGSSAMIEFLCRGKLSGSRRLPVASRAVVRTAGRDADARHRPTVDCRGVRLCGGDLITLQRTASVHGARITAAVSFDQLLWAETF
jgi:hypothetical protein